MKKLILLTLLIVGCAPTKPSTASFLIGMTNEEFKEKNPRIKHMPFSMGNKRVAIENEGSFNEYIFAFDNDTLFAVYHNVWNMTREKEIDYSKYHDSKPEWFAAKPNKEIKVNKKLQDFVIRIIGTGILLYIVFRLYLAFAP